MVRQPQSWSSHTLIDPSTFRSPFTLNATILCCAYRGRRHALRVPSLGRDVACLLFCSCGLLCELRTGQGHIEAARH
jgi:hypothetical protein